VFYKSLCHFIRIVSYLWDSHNRHHTLKVNHSPDFGDSRTGQFKDVKTGGKRFVDTGVLITEFATYPFDSERYARAIARVNYLHSHYNISNDDLLYTLSVFITVPQEFLEKYEWRSLSEIELAVCPRIPN
jgi:hypothetical protein